MKTCRNFVSLLVLLLVLAVCPAYAAAWDGTQDTSWYSPDKTTFEISTAEQLAGLGAILGGDTGLEPDSFSGKTVKLTADIDLGGVKNANGTWGGKVWQPLGRGYALVFGGVFDGQGHKISNMYINSTAKDVYVGLFTMVNKGGSVRNLTIESGYINSTDAKAVGGVVGSMNSNGRVINCVNRADIVSDTDTAGGIVGSLTGDTHEVSTGAVMACTNYGSVKSAGSNVGGIVGSLYNSIAWGCCNHGSVSGQSFCGGIVGLMQYSQANDCYNLGNIYAEKKYVGGIFGATDKEMPRSYASNYRPKIKEISSCYNSGKISSGSADKENAGLLAGVYIDNYDCCTLAMDNLPAFGTETAKGGNTPARLDSAALKGAAATLGKNYVAGSGYPMFAWQKNGGALPQDADGFAVKDITAYSATGCTVVMNKRLGYDNLLPEDITLTVTVKGQKVEPKEMESKVSIVKHNGQYVFAVTYTWEPLGSNKNISMTATYKQTAAKTVSFRSEHTNNWLYYAADEFAGGSGSYDDPYLIATPQQLALMATLFNDTSNTSLQRKPAEANFKLVADIDLGAKRWEAPASFAGVFDGNGHTISNLHGKTGLFGQVNAVNDSYYNTAVPAANQICNLTLRNANVENNNYTSGILARYLADCNLINCKIEDSQLNLKHGHGYMGAFASTIKCSDALDTVVVEGCSVKNVQLNRAVDAPDSVLSVEKTVSGIGGGFFGIVESESVGVADTDFIIRNCSFDGTVNNCGGSAGGLIGYLIYVNKVTVENCWVAGSIINPGAETGTKMGYSGGLIGQIPTSDVDYIGEGGIVLNNNVVMLDSVSGMANNTGALNSDLTTFVGAGTAHLSGNRVAAAMQLRGAAVIENDVVAYELADAAALADKAFWAGLGFDFTEDGLWQWDDKTNKPQLKHDGLQYTDCIIVQQPIDAKLYGDRPAYFGVDLVGGLNVYQYQWQYSKNGRDWNSINNANQAVLEVKQGEGYGDNTSFRCVISQPYASDVVSGTARVRFGGGSAGPAAVQADLLKYYQQRGTIENALEATALYAAGADLKAFKDERVFFKAYLDERSDYGFDFYTNIYDSYVLGNDVTDEMVIWKDKEEQKNWIEHILNGQNAKTGMFNSKSSKSYDINNDNYAVTMISALEMFFGGSNWGNESVEQKLGRDNGIAAIMADLQEDRNGRIWFNSSSSYGGNSAKEFEASEAEFVMLMCRLADDEKWAAKAKEAADKVLNSIGSLYDEEHAANKLYHMKSVRDNAEYVSALVAYAKAFAPQAEKADYMARARKVLEETVLVSNAVGGGYSYTVGEHDMTPDAKTTAAVLMAVTDYINGNAFLSEYVYDMAPEVAVKQVIGLVSFPQSIAEDLDLSTSGAFGTTLSWTSSDPAVISNDGKVTRGAERQKVTLKLTATKGNAIAEQTFKLVVRAIGADDNDDVDEALAKAADKLSLYTETISNVVLPQSLTNGVEFSWASSDPAVIAVDGKVTRPAVGAADKTVTLTLTAKKGNVSKNISQKVLVYAQSNTKTNEGKIREAYLYNRTGYLHNRIINGYWEIFAAYSVLGDYLNAENGYVITLPEPAEKWYGTQYGAMVMGIAAAGENPYNYRGVNWVQLLNKNYGGMYAAGLYSALGMDAAGADPEVYHHRIGSGVSLTKDLSMGIDIAGWAAVCLAAVVGDTDLPDYDYYEGLKNDFIQYMAVELGVDKTGNFKNSNAISTNCVLLGLNALYWAGVEEAYPLADAYRNSENGMSIVDASYNANWEGGTEFGGYSGQAVLTFGDLYNVLYKGGAPCWLDIAMDKTKLEKQVAKAEALLAEADKYTAESVEAVKTALAVVKAMPASRLDAYPVPWGKEYYDLYDAVRFAEVLDGE